MKSFPRPCAIGDAAARWRLSDVLTFEAGRAGEAPPHIDPAADRYLSARAVATRLGISVSTVWRWAAESRAIERQSTSA